MSIEIGKKKELLLEGKPIPGVTFREGRWWMKTELIQTGANPRKDFGDLDGLAASIEAEGIKQNLNVRFWLEKGNIRNELEAGERRLKVARKKKMVEVPITPMTGTEEQHFVGRLVENMQREDFNPLEEGRGFKDLMQKFKMTAENLSKKVGKTKTYIERRVALLYLDEDTKKALISKKIQIGHALALLKVEDAKERKEALKETQNNDYSVGSMIDYLRRNICDLKHAPFDKEECKGCKHNGGTPNLMSFMDTQELKEQCLNRNCFLKKEKEWLAAKKEEFKKNGITILSEKQKDELKRHRSIRKEGLGKNYKKNCLGGCENYAVCISKNWQGKTEIEELCLKPLCYENNGELPKKKKASEMTEVEIKTEEKEKAARNEDLLGRKVRDYKDNLMQVKTREMHKHGTHEAKALVLYALVDSAGYSDSEEVLNKIKLEFNDMKGILKVDDKTLMWAIFELSKSWIEKIGNEEIDALGKGVGVDLTKHWKIDQEYINLYRGSDLKLLAKELKIDISNCKKVSEIKAAILAADNKGKVPKIMG